MEEVNKQNTENIDSIIESLVGEHKVEEVIEVDLPSRGVGYIFKDNSNKLKIRPMTFLDEKIILSAQKGGKDAVATLLDRCVLNTNPDKMYIFDKLFVLLKIREASYGDSYSATAPCPDCSKDNNLEIKINSLVINYVEESFSNPIELHLPKINKVAKVRIPRVEDEHLLGNFDKSTKNLWRFVVSVDNHTNPVLISKLIDKLPLKDANTIIKAILNPKYGVIPTVKMECSQCQKINTVDLPITSDFFMGS